MAGTAGPEPPGIQAADAQPGITQGASIEDSFVQFILFGSPPPRDLGGGKLTLKTKQKIVLLMNLLVFSQYYNLPKEKISHNSTP